MKSTFFILHLHFSPLIFKVKIQGGVIIFLYLLLKSSFNLLFFCQFEEEYLSSSLEINPFLSSGWFVIIPVNNW